MPEKPTTVVVTLLVNASHGDLGVEGHAGDEVEVDAEVAERWIAAGIAEGPVAPAPPPPEPPAEAPTKLPPTSGKKS